jgi:ketosteroid isomerase-like protein
VKRQLAALFVAVAVTAPIAEAEQLQTALSAIEEVERRFAAALEARDRPALEKVLTDQFTWIHASDGRVDAREDWLANAARGMALSGQRSERTEHGASVQWHGSPRPHTAIRIARIRLLDAANKRESWLRQTHVLVRGEDGGWRVAMGQGVVMYEGPELDLALHQRYAGTYVISPDRKLVLAWEDGSLQATFPSGARTQIFLASPTEEASRTVGAGSLRFTLGDDGRPAAVSLVRRHEEVWRAKRE